MKIRQGFVSNSSSSNFIIAFNKKPTSAKKLQKLMFGNCESNFPHPYDEKFSVPLRDIAKAVYDQLVKQLSLDEIIEELMDGWLDDVRIDQYNDPNKPEIFIKDENGKEIYNPAYDEYQEQIREKETIRALEYFNRWVGKHDQVFYCVKFSDEDGKFGCLCEHGGIFDNIHNIKISHH